jgi:hypothetical protein
VGFGRDENDESEFDGNETQINRKTRSEIFNHIFMIT